LSALRLCARQTIKVSRIESARAVNAKIHDKRVCTGPQLAEMAPLPLVGWTVWTLLTSLETNCCEVIEVAIRAAKEIYLQR